MTPAEKLVQELKNTPKVKRGRRPGQIGKRWKCHIGEKRRLLDLTASSVAKAIGISRQRLLQIETYGEGCGMEIIRKLEDFFGCSHRDLWEPLTITTPN